MFNFTSTQEAGKTVAVLGDYSVRFFASNRNTRITSKVEISAEDEEFRSSGTLFFHYDATAQGHGNRDVGAKQYDWVAC